MMINSSTSLFDSGAIDVFVACAEWIKALLAGTLATSLSIISIACIGFLLLKGRLALDRVAWVLVGAFMIMGAGKLSAGIFAITQSGNGEAPASSMVSPPPAGPPTSPHEAQAFDPYAGASVPQQQ